MQALYAAALARLQAVYTPARVHEQNRVPTLPALPYAVFGMDTTTPRNYSLAGDHGTRRVELVVQISGQTLAEVLFVAAKADAAFLDQALAVTGWSTTVAERAVTTRPIRDPDGNPSMYALHTYVFEAVKEPADD